MSYDYNDLLHKIQTSRSIEQHDQTPLSIQETLNLFTTLSTKCPMTPLLWMQYAYDAGRILILLQQQQEEEEGDGGGDGDGGGGSGSESAAHYDITGQILELGIAEFPSCAMLRLFHLDCVVARCRFNPKDGNSNGSDSDSDSDSNTVKVTEVKKTWNDIADSICLGCHGGCDENIVLALFSIYTNFLIQVEEPSGSASSVASAVAQLFERRGKLFMRNGNDAMRSEMDLLSQKYGIIFTDHDYDNVEAKRQFASQYLSFLGNLEDDVLIAMQADGIASSPDLDMYIIEKDEEKDIVKNQAQGYFYDWCKILNAMEKSSTYLMGFGMMQTSASFAKYIQAIGNKIRYLQKLIKQSDTKKDNDGDDDLETNDRDTEENQYLLDMLNKMMIPIFERGVSECPTVEIMWEKYVKHLFYILHDVPDKESMVVTQTLNHLKGVTSRAVRNCPYSVKLFKLKMEVIQEEVKTGRKVLEPDELINIVNEATEGKFLPTPESNVEIYIAAFGVVKQRILDVVSRATSSMEFDEAEQIDKNRGKKRKRGGGDQSASSVDLYNIGLDEEIDEEVSDLIDDLREMYDAADKFVRTNFKELTGLREKIFRERAITESSICIPLLSNGSNKLDEAVEHYEKMIKIHQPVHPDSWRCYIRFLMGINFVTQDNGNNDLSCSQSAGSVAAKFRYVRSLYHQSMACTKKDKMRRGEPSRFDSTFIDSFKVLCQDFLHFESSFGSPSSQTSAKKMVDGKLALMNVTPSQEHIFEEKMTGEPSQEPEKAQEKAPDLAVKEPENVSTEKEGAKLETDQNGSDTKLETTQSHKVKVGKMVYPAHPFTVHVSNLSPLTEDMDLYDLFRPKCGAIVHVRIFREKSYGKTSHGHGQKKPDSKCAGLIQFEERESVEKAIKLDGELGLNEKLIHIARSHQPAVSVVPPGMHRVQSKGDGKSTKRNQKRKERRQIGDSKDVGVTNTNIESKNGANVESSANTSVQQKGSKSDKESSVQQASDEKGSKSVYTNKSTGILTFRPRGVKKQRKTKVTIGRDSK